MDNVCAGNVVTHPTLGRKIALPPRDKLKWIGGNLALDTPVCEEAIDSDGNWLHMTLHEVLDRLDDFVGGRAPGLSMQSALISNAFTAYQYNLLSQSERGAFEAFVRGKLGTVPALEAARKLMVSM